MPLSSEIRNLIDLVNRFAVPRFDLLIFIVTFNYTLHMSILQLSNCNPVYDNEAMILQSRTCNVSFNSTYDNPKYSNIMFVYHGK